MSNKRVLKIDHLTGLSSVQNFIRNAIPVENTDGYVTYADAAGVVPVDGTGGSANVTWTRDTGTPLYFVADFLFTKDAANRQGQGVSYDFTIPLASQNKRMRLSCDMSVASGTFVGGQASDLQFFIYDVDNSVLIYPHTSWIGGSRGLFQTVWDTSDSTNYRLIIHCATTSTAAFTVKFSNFEISPSVAISSAAVGNAVPYTPILTSFGNGTADLRTWQVGERIFIRGTLTVGSSLPAGTIRFSAPPNGQPDLSKMALTATVSLTTGYAADGRVFAYDYSAGTVPNVGAVVWDNGAGNFLMVGADFFNASYPFTLATGDILDIDISYPASGLSSSVLLANTRTFRISKYLANGTRVTGVPARLGEYRSMYKSGGSATQTLSDADPSPAITEADGMPIYGTGTANSASAAGEICYYEIFIGKNKCFQLEGYANVNRSEPMYFDQVLLGTSEYYGAYRAYDPNTGIFYIKALNQISTGTTFNKFLRYDGAGASNGRFDIVVSDSPTTMAASPQIIADYKTASGQTISHSSLTILNFNSLVKDTHGAVQTGASWRFVAPETRRYRISILIFLDAASWPIGRFAEISIYKNGGQLRYIDSSYQPVAHSTYVKLNGSTEIDLIENEYFDIRMSQNSGGSVSLLNNDTINWITISGVGN